MKTPIAKIPLVEVEYDFQAEASTVCARHPEVVIGSGDCDVCERMAGEFPAETLDNRTAQDARDRVIQAKMGSLAGATDVYLETLEHELQVWLASIKDETALRILKWTSAQESENA